MDTVDMTLSTPTEVTISPETNKTVTVSIEDVKQSDVLDYFDAEDIVKHFGADALLKEIGEQAAVDHFKLELKEE